MLAVLVLVTSGARADTDTDLVQTFADCAGRLSAEIEHAWLVGGADRAFFEERRDATLGLLAAVTEEAQSARAMDLRVRAKHAHARLLLHARFHTDPHTARLSGRRAATRIRACMAMLLG